MKKLAAFYFSGTGNTKYVTELICGKLSGQYDFVVRDVAEGGGEEISAADLLLFAFPIYGSAPPRPMVNFVRRNASRIKGKECAVVATQYFFSGDGAASLGRCIQRLGGRVRYAEHFNMPNNLSDSPAFRIRNGAEIQKTLERAERRADRFAQKIRKGRSFRRGFHPVSHAVGYFCQRRWWRKGENEKKGKLRIDGSKCVGCGLCAKRCPVRNIEMKDGRARARADCIFCYRCVNLCPRKAIRLFGKQTREQYRGPV